MLNTIKSYLSIGLAIVFAGLVFYVYLQSQWLEAKTLEVEKRDLAIESLKNDIKVAQDVNTENQKAVMAMQTMYDQLYIFTKQYEDRAKERADRLESALEDINSAPLTDDGPVAPVLSRQLERMRADVNKPAGGQDQTRNASNTDAGFGM